MVNNSQTLINASSKLAVSLFDELLDCRVTSEDASLVFESVFNNSNPSWWASERGLKIATSLLQKGARGEGVGSALITVLKQSDTAHHSPINAFGELLLEYGADINYNHGEALQLAAAQGNAVLLTKLLSRKPNIKALGSAFSKIFDTPLGEDKVHELITLFSEYRDGDNELDVMSTLPDSEPTIIRALSQYPRSTKILETLLDIGFYHDQITTCRVTDDVEEPESVTLLMWALLQPQKKISTGVINLLIERGGKHMNQFIVMVILLIH